MNTVNKPLILVSLTEAGCLLAQRLQKQLGGIHLNRPKPFGATLQARYQAGHRLLLICATGIAVRTLAPVLRDKYQDPAVLVLDEAGRHVIPLLSGHEGGANEWARQVAELTGGQAIITSAETYTRPVYVAGMGCDRGCPEELLQVLMTETLQAHGLSVDQLTAIASIDLKQDEEGLNALARRLALPFTCFPAATLNRYEERLSRRSEIVFREVGCYGVAEAAALAQAEALCGGRAELLIPKHKNARATFALARAYRSESDLVGSDRSEPDISDSDFFDPGFSNPKSTSFEGDA